MDFGAGFRERKVKANGINVRVVTSSDEGKAPLLMLHGIYDRAENWLPVAEALARDYWLIMPDLRGHYRSDWPEQGYDLTDYASDAVGLLDAFGIEQASVLGHSLGALITMVLAGQAPDRVRTVVLEDPPSDLNDDSRVWLGALLNAKRGTPEQAYVAMQAMHPDRGEAYWRREAEWLRSTADGPFLALSDTVKGEPERFETAISRISCSILLLQADPRMDAALSTAAARKAISAHANCRLVNFPESGHTIHRDKPEEFIEAVSGFLRES